MAEAGSSAARDDQPGLNLAATLVLISLGFLPLMGGGYSSGGAFQVGFVLLPLAAALAWWNCNRRPRLVTVVLLVYAAFVIALPWWVQGGRELWYYVFELIFAWIGTWVILTQVPRLARWLWPVTIGGAVLAAIYAWVLWPASGQLGYQLTGTFGLHNAFAGYLLLAWPASLVAALTHRERAWRWGFALAGVFLAATLVLTYSRAAWLVFGLQLLALIGWLIWKRSGLEPATRRMLAGAGGVLLAGLVLLLLLPPVREALGRLLNFQGYSFQGRLRFWQAAVEIFRDHLWLGVGPGNFAYVYPQYQLDYVYFSVDPHCWILQLLCELGLLGALVVVLCLAGWWLWTRRLVRGSGGSLSAALLIVAVTGSLAHAAVDFDYTFGATTALLGVLLAFGTHLAPGEGSSPSGGGPAFQAPFWDRIALTLTLALLVLGIGFGELLTLERYQLDHLRDNPNMAIKLKVALLKQALQYNRFNHRTQYQLASIQGNPGQFYDVDAAREHVESCLKLNPRYAKAWALKGLLAEDHRVGSQYIEHALELDKYNYPEHYFYYANLAPDDATKRIRLLLGLKRIPVDAPITPDHVRPTWYELNPMWAQWYYELARLTDDPDEKERYRKLGASFQAYWEGVLRERTKSD